MNALYFVAARTGDGTTSEEEDNSYRPWFADSPAIYGWSGTDYKAIFLGQVFGKDQATLDSIAADARTIFSLPVVVNDGWKLSWPAANLSSTDRAKIDAWLSSQKLKARPSGERSPGKIAEHVMLEVNGRLPAKGVLDGWRVHW